MSVVGMLPIVYLICFIYLGPFLWNQSITFFYLPPFEKCIFVAKARLSFDALRAFAKTELKSKKLTK